MTSDYYCLLFSFHSPDKRVERVSFILGPETATHNESAFFVRSKGDDWEFGLNFAPVKEIYQSIKRHRENNMTEVAPLVFQSSDPKAGTVVAITGHKVFALSLTAGKIVDRTMCFQHEASWTTALDKQQAEETALQLSRIKWPLSDGWSHHVHAKEITIDIVLGLKEDGTPVLDVT